MESGSLLGPRDGTIAQVGPTGKRDMKVASRGGEASRGKRRWVWSDPQMDGGTVSKTFLVGLGAPKKKRVRLVGTRSFGLEAWRG